MCVVVQTRPGIADILGFGERKVIECFMSKKDKEVVSKQKESPFLLVEHGKDGLWYVLESPFNTAGISFNERQDACDYASERARTKKDSMVLLREQEERRKFLRALTPSQHSSAGVVVPGSSEPVGSLVVTSSSAEPGKVEPAP